MDRNVFLTLTVRNVPMSLSARRAWIEMPWFLSALSDSVSLSARRAWIEICVWAADHPQNYGRSPQGERG